VECFPTDDYLEAIPNQLSQYPLEWTSKITRGIKQLVEAQQTTVYTFLMTMMNVLIWKYANRKDIGIGTIYSGREVASLNKQIGMFAKTLLLRTQLKPQEVFADLILKTQRQLLKINAHQNIAFAQLGQFNFDVLVVYQNPDFSINGEQQLGDLILKPIAVKCRESRLPLAFNFYEKDQQLCAVVHYDASRYSSETIEIILFKMTQLIEVVLENPLCEIGSIDLELSFEKQENVAIDFDF
ncbi:MAG: condensation domain-containing protein, partial [Bacteroidota bacterium]